MFDINRFEGGSKIRFGIYACSPTEVIELI